jgi:hypothetical protein
MKISEFWRFRRDGTLLAIGRAPSTHTGVRQMLRLASAFVIAGLVTAFLVDGPANGDDSSVAALAAKRTITRIDPPPRSLSLDDYAGVYETVDGATFVVARDGESFTISLPESVALPIRAAGPGFVLDVSLTHVAFEADGDCVRLVLTGAFEEPLVATRVPLRRGVVTIQDI